MWTRLIYLAIFVGDDLLALVQIKIYPSSSEVTLKDMGKLGQYQNSKSSTPTPPPFSEQFAYFLGLVTKHIRPLT